jgi:hypothetical protein
MFFRFILVNIFSFIKRFFAFNATLYSTIVFIPLFTVLSPTISKRSLLFVVIFSFILLITGNITSYGNFILYFMLLLAIPMFKKVSFEKLLSSSFWFFVIVCLYGLSQKFFGYTPIEKRWIQSGLSFADEREFLNDDIRPFSTFASMPEFTFFVAIFVYYFKSQGKTLMLLFAFVMLYIAGSRGVFVSTLVAYFFTFFIKKYNAKYLFLAFLTSLLIFLALVFVFPILFASADTTSRMLAYGTFNGRVELLARVLENASISSIFTGININALGLVDTFDNLYFMLIAHFGIFGCLYFLLFFLKQKINKKNTYFFTIFLGYGFYADVVFSYYLMFLFFFAIYSYSEEIDSFLSNKLPAAEGGSLEGQIN